MKKRASKAEIRSLLEPQDLIPKDLEIKSNSRQELIFLGRENLKRLVWHWRERMRRIRFTLGQCHARMRLLQMTQAELLRYAARFEQPWFTKIISIKTAQQEIIVPWDAQSLLRKKGASSLVCCGWCRFNCCTQKIFECAHTTSCQFYCFADQGDDESLSFNTSCRLILASTALKKHLMAKHREGRRTLSLNVKRIKLIVRALRGLSAAANPKPLLPLLRPPYWLAQGERVAFLLGRLGLTSLQADNEWGMGTVVQSDANTVQLFSDEAMHNSVSGLMGHSLIFQAQDASLLRAAERNYLVANAAFAQVWLDYAQQETACLQPGWLANNQGQSRSDTPADAQPVPPPLN